MLCFSSYLNNSVRSFLTFVQKRFMSQQNSSQCNRMLCYWHNISSIELICCCTLLTKFFVRNSSICLNCCFSYSCIPSFFSYVFFKRWVYHCTWQFVVNSIDKAKNLKLNKNKSCGEEELGKLLLRMKKTNYVVWNRSLGPHLSP